MEDINKRIEDVKDKMARISELESDVKKLTNQMKALIPKRDMEYHSMKEQENTLKKLQGFSVSGFLHSLRGSKLERLDECKNQYDTSRASYNRLCKEIDELTNRIIELNGHISLGEGLIKEYAALLKEKERLILSSAHNGAQNELTSIENQKKMLQDAIKEINEAISAGKQLLIGLERVKKHLDSAGNWGVADMLGGGMLVTMAKHSKISDAKQEVNRVQVLLRNFQRELQDLGGKIDINLEIGSFLTFADYFFDGLFADWAVQSKINDAKNKVSSAIGSVSHIVTRLEYNLRDNSKRIDGLNQDKINIIENT